MANTPICTIDAAGIHKPSLATVLAYFVGKYQGIYGSDTYLGSDSQDGELLGLLASAVDDANAMCVQAYNAFSPATAQGVGLSSNVKLNGIARKVPTYSSAPILVVGVVGTTINSGVVTDANGNAWALPATVIIPLAGQITVSATCAVLGAISAPANTIAQISTPTAGWQSATNTSAATPGTPVETDPALRIRQSISTQIPSNTMLGGIIGAVAAVPGVARMRAYQNETNVPDSNGIPGYSIAVVTDGGDPIAIANAISMQKFAAGTYGTTSEVIVDAFGVSHTINFFYVSEPNITWSVTVNPLAGFSANTLSLIQASLAAWTNSVGIGNGIQITRAYAAAYLATSITAAAQALQNAVALGDPIAIAAAAASFTTLNQASTTYEVTALLVARDAGTPTSADVSIAFNEAPVCVVAGVTVTS